MEVIDIAKEIHASASAIRISGHTSRSLPPNKLERTNSEENSRKMRYGGNSDPPTVGLNCGGISIR
ncbi:MAG: hypothetical protein MUF47_04120 [Porphyrobacter sp.]|nr:hypothetical protein [Porphyrobacter sp.]